MSLTNDKKIKNLWKKSRGVVDIEKEVAYYDVAQKPFVENILNKDIFSNEVPDEIPGQLINVTGFGQISENSVMALDQIFHSANPSVPPGSVLPSIPVNERSNEIAGYEGYKLSSIGYPHLTYYHRIPLIEHPTSNRTKPGQQVKTTWYIPDSNNPELSALRYSINFKKGGFRHYEQKFYIDTGTANLDLKEGFSPHLMVFDNKSGYVLLYGDDDSAFNWKITSTSTGSTGPLLMSFIRYEGPLGAGSGGGLDVSFNNVDISNNLNIVHGDLETGILQSLKINHIPTINTGGRDSIIIAKVEDAYDTLLNATGYFTLELVDGQAVGEYHTKIHFLAGITTKEGSNTDAPKSGGSTGGSTGTSSVLQNDPLSSEINQSSLSNILDPVNIGIIKNPIKVDPGIIYDPIPVDPIDPLTTIYLVTVKTINGINKFLIDGEETPVLNFVFGNTYIFDQSDPSNLGHQLQITEEPQPGIPVDYSITTGEPGKNDSKVTITIPDIKNRVLYYLCLPHGIIMGNQINLSDEITILPIVDEESPVASPILDTGVIDEGGNNQITALTSTTTTNIEYNGFIKVLSCLRQYHNSGNNDIGIQYINLAYDTGANICYLILDTKHTSSVTNLTFNIRLYKNSLNIMDENNKLQWTLDYIQPSPSFSLIKTIYIGSDPDPNQLGNIEYPYHPQEPFTATTQYTVVDNSMNVYGNLNIKGDINCDSSLIVANEIEHATSTVIKEVNYNNNNFQSYTSVTGSGGRWQTIARTQTFLDVHLRRASAIFEVFDKSNTIDNTTGAGGVKDPGCIDDYILFSVNWQYDTYIGQTGFHNIDANTGMIAPPRCTINVINSRCGTNFDTSINLGGWISSLRVETNFILDSNGNHQAVAQIQIKRHSSGTQVGAQLGQGVTDVKVRILNDNLGINNDTLNWNLVSNSFFFTVPSSQNGSHILEFPLCKYDYTTNTLTDNNRTGVVSSTVVNGDLKSTYFDKLKSDYLRLSGELDMNDGNIINVSKISKDTASDKPRIEFDGDKVKINFDDSQVFSQLEIGNTDSNNNIKIKCGSAYGTNSSRLDMNEFDIENTGKITNFNATGSLQNRAYVQEIEYNLGDLLPANNAWISIAKLGKFNQLNPPVITETNMRGDALVELENRSGNYHHIVKFRIQYTYGNPNIRVISNNFMSGSSGNPKFKQLRLAFRNAWPGIYTGCVLQFKLDSSTNTSVPGKVHMKIWQNCPEGSLSGGWKFDTRLFSNDGFGRPLIYVPDNLHGQTNSNDPPPYFNTTYPNEISVSLETSGELQQTNKLAIKNDFSLTGNIEMSNGNIEMSNGNITGVNIIDGDTGSNGILTIRSNNNGLQTSSGYINIDSPYRMPNSSATLCNQSLVNADPATFTYSNDTNTILYKPDNTNHPEVNNNLLLSNTSTMQLWDWTTDYNGAKNSASPPVSIWSPSYSERGSFSPWSMAPHHLSPGTGNFNPLPLLYDEFKPLHDGFLTGVTFRTAYGSQNNFVEIKRTYGFGMPNTPASTFELICVVSRGIHPNITTTTTKIGNLLVGPGPGGAGGSVIRVSNNGPYNFTINPRTTLIKFNKLDSINFKLRWVSKSVLGDSIKVDVSNASSSGLTIAGIIAYFKYYVDS